LKFNLPLNAWTCHLIAIKMSHSNCMLIVYVCRRPSVCRQIISIEYLLFWLTDPSAFKYNYSLYNCFWGDCSLTRFYTREAPKCQTECFCFCLLFICWLLFVACNEFRIENMHSVIIYVTITVFWHKGGGGRGVGSGIPKFELFIFYPISMWFFFNNVKLIFFNFLFLKGS
jgi:hypothetical protein